MTRFQTRLDSSPLTSRTTLSCIPILLAGLMLVSTANAHQTWIAPASSLKKQEFKLVSGHHFPQGEITVPQENILEISCLEKDGISSLSAVGDHFKLPLACVSALVQTKKLPITLPRPKFLTHLRENGVSLDLNPAASAKQVQEEYDKVAQLYPVSYESHKEYADSLDFVFVNKDSNLFLLSKGQPVINHPVYVEHPEYAFPFPLKSSSFGEVIIPAQLATGLVRTFKTEVNDNGLYSSKFLSLRSSFKSESK